MLLHLLTTHDWAAARSLTRYSPGSLATDGFVHCTGDDTTMLAVANRFYASTPGELVVLSLDEAALTGEIRWESPAHPDGRPATADEPLFPHVYGPIELAAVRLVRTLRRDPAGVVVGFGPELP